MAIIQNLPCPQCQENGHDKTGNHLIVFEDGAKLCSKASYHKSGRALYVAGDGTDPALDADISGKIRYTQRQFSELVDSGRLSSPALRALALSGMSGEDRYACSTPDEREAQEAVWNAELKFFEGLKIKHLIDRHINGKFAKLYNVRVGHDEAGAVSRHYYPVYSAGELIGAKCRTLPKDFKYGHLGHMWGAVDLFGMHCTQAVMDSGTRKYKLLVVGGECDAMAAQEMLADSQKGTKYEGQLFHVVSVTKGEASIEQILQNKEWLNQFKEIIWAFDDDDTGKKLTRECARLFPLKSKGFTWPTGCKDPNDCLKKGKAKEFVDAWFNPAEVGAGSKIKSVSMLSKRAKEVPAMGRSWPWPGLNRITLGMRCHMLFVWGAGSGVGKTEVTKEIVKHEVDTHDTMVGVIYTEEAAHITVRSYAGKWINKRLQLPPVTNKNDPDYDVSRDYTEEQANKAIDALDDSARLYVADLAGDTHIDTIMATCEEMLAMGITTIVIDNLTGITMDGSKGNKVEALDEAMKRIGNFKDEKPVTIHLITHLTKPGNGRTPHEEGGEVLLDDFRGSGAIKFWANYAFGIRRNTRADTVEERCVTYIECIKDRDMGIMAGEKVLLLGKLDTGRLLEPAQHRSLPRETPKQDEAPSTQIATIETEEF